MTALTERDLAVVCWVGEQYGAPLGVVRELLRRQLPDHQSASSPGGGWRQAGQRPDTLAAARKWTGRMVSARLVSAVQVLGRTWVVPTRAGLDFADLPYKVWRPTGWKLGHVAAVGWLRLALQDQYPEATWTSERAIRSRWAGSGARVRYADGQLNFETVCVGVELELHRKREHDYAGIAADVDPAFDQCWWFVPSLGGDPTGNVAWLRRVLDGIPKGPRPEHHVIPLAGDLAGVLR